MRLFITLLNGNGLIIIIIIYLRTVRTSIEMIKDFVVINVDIVNRNVYKYYAHALTNRYIHFHIRGLFFFFLLLLFSFNNS